MKAYHVIKEIVTFSSLIVHKDHTKLDYIPLSRGHFHIHSSPLSAQMQQSRFREAELLTGLLRVVGEDGDGI